MRLFFIDLNKCWERKAQSTTQRIVLRQVLNGGGRGEEKHDPCRSSIVDQRADSQKKSRKDQRMTRVTSDSVRNQTNGNITGNKAVEQQTNSHTSLRLTLKCCLATVILAVVFDRREGIKQRIAVINFLHSPTTYQTME